MTLIVVPGVSLGQSRIFTVDPVIDGVGAVSLVSTSLLIDGQKHRWSMTDPCHSVRRPPTDAERGAYLRLEPDAGLCDRNEVAAIDRWVTEMDSHSAALVSDVLLYSLVASPLVFTGIDTPASGTTAARMGEDSAVTFQALGATYLATVLLKMVVARPRPLTYSPSFDKSVRFKGDARLSFPSGHASLSFAAASVLSVMLAERFGDSPGAVAGITGSYLAATGAAAARVLGGKHFLTDVLAGAVLGTALGLTIPLLHTKRRQPAGGFDRTNLGPPTAMIGFGGVL